LNRYKSISAIFSILAHSLIFLGFIYVETAKTSPEEKSELVEVGFGDGSGSGGGGFGSELNPGKYSSPEAQKSEDLKSQDNNEERVAPAKRGEEAIKSAGTGTKNARPNKGGKEGDGGSASGFGTGKGAGIGPGEGDGLGFNIDWGGGGRRKILAYPLPQYPSGTNKQLDVKIRFSILPDGTVGMKTLLTKGDSRLENAALSAIQMWRFEQLPTAQKNFVQSAVIVFQFRLR
jgi:protein TonB